MVQNNVLNFMLTPKVLSFGFLGLILIGIYFMPPQGLLNNDFGFCLHREILGFDCPGCGMTRAIHFFLHMEFSKALQFNFAVSGLFPFLISQAIYQLTSLRKLKLIQTFMLYLLVVLLTIVYLTRIIDLINVN